MVLRQSRAVLKGRTGEQMAPLFPLFKHNPSDARFIGSPIDYVIFDGYTEVKDEKADEPIEITFLDVKTGEKATLTPVQERAKDIVEKGRVKWEILHL